MIIGMNAARLLFLAAILFVSTAPTSLAQTNGSLSFDNSSITLQPAFPEPGQTVEATLNIYGTELFNADIVWSLNGVVIGDVNNRRTVEYTAGELGVTDTLTTTLVRPDQNNRRYSVSYEPSYLDIIIEAQTRTPDFYQGRSVPSIGSQMNVTALLNNGSIRTENIIYTWRLNNKVLAGGPIKGSNQIAFDTPRGSESILTVELLNTSGVAIGRRSIVFNAVYPDVVFYESNTLFGQSHIAITDGLIMTGPAATVIAEPYNLDIRTYNDPDINEWEIDGSQTTSNGASPYRITIQRTGESGSSDVSFHVRSTSQLLQGSKESFDIIF